MNAGTSNRKNTALSLVYVMYCRWHYLSSSGSRQEEQHVKPNLSATSTVYLSNQHKATIKHNIGCIKVLKIDLPVSVEINTASCNTLVR
jgi:hypothetical protein